MNEKIISILLDAKRNLNHEDLKKMREIEEYFHFNSFDNETAVNLGKCIKDVSSNKEKGAFIKIINLETSKTIYKDFGKGTSERNEIFADMKANMVKISKHNSFYPLIMYAIGFETIDFFKNETALMASGAFPVFVNNELKYIIETSGLHDGDDFRIVIKGMELFLNKKLPEYTGWII